MPNLCECQLTIIGNNQKDEIKKFIKRAKIDEVEPSDISIEKFLPTPKELDDTDTETENSEFIKKYGASNWYDWRVMNWGTKWDIIGGERTSEDDEDEKIDYMFETAWSPPIEALQSISKLYPKFVFVLKYEETLTGFIGIAKFINGKVDNKVINY